MEESKPAGPKKIRLTKSEVYAMRIASPRKKRIAFGLVGLLVMAALGNVLLHFQDVWLSYWLPEEREAPLPAAAPGDAQPPPAAESPRPAPPPQAVPEPPPLDFLSAIPWDDPRFVQGVKTFNQSLDLFRRFRRDGAPGALLAQAAQGADRAAQLFGNLKAEAPAAVPLADYAARCRRLAAECRRLAQPPAPAPRPPSPAPSAVPAPKPGEAWQHPDYLQGARLFNQALEQYQVFLADKSRADLLKAIEDGAFEAAKKFESLKGQAPESVPIGDHVTQCYKLISDCRRQHLEGGPAEPDNDFDRGTAGPRRRPALPAYQPQ